jgi:putative heme-binding domain-containing protein
MRVVFVAALLAGYLPAQQHGYTPADVERGSRLYAANCIGCHGAEGDSVPGVSFRRGLFRRGSSDEALMRTISTGIAGTRMPPGNFNPAELFSLVAYLNTLRDGPAATAAHGDAARGRALFEGKGGCRSCHRIQGAGSRVGPDLSDVGAIRPAAYLLQSLTDPGQSVLAEHQFVRAVTREGTIITGRRLNEDTHTLQIIDAGEQLVSLSKSDLREFASVKGSAMPSFRDKLTAAELADLVAYLSSLRGRE